MTPLVVGLDLSITATGVAHPTGDTTETWRPTTTGDNRLSELVTRVRDATNQTDLVVLEGPVLRSASALALGMLHGAVRVALTEIHVPYIVAPPATLKVYATGKGTASKADMRMALYRRAGLDIPDEDQVDAWWLRAIGLDLLGHPELELPQTHRRALDRLRLPDDLARHDDQQRTR